VPVITGWSCADCGVASLSIDYYVLGQVTAELAYEILVEGADPGTLAVRSAPTATAQYNPEICDALGITVPETYVAVG